MLLAGASVVLGDRRVDPWTSRAISKPMDKPEKSRAALAGAASVGLHDVGGDYVFRVEERRAGPGGNGPMNEVLDGLATIHARALDLISSAGDVDTADDRPKWAQILDALRRLPALVNACYPAGQPDLNVVDRTIPAQAGNPKQPPASMLAPVRMLSAMEAVQEEAAYSSMDRRGSPAQAELSEMLEPQT